MWSEITRHHEGLQGGVLSMKLASLGDLQSLHSSIAYLAGCTGCLLMIMPEDRGVVPGPKRLPDWRRVCADAPHKPLRVVVQGDVDCVAATA